MRHASLLRRLWVSLHEPRAVTAVMVAVYGIATGVGLALAVLPPAWKARTP